MPCPRGTFAPSFWARDINGCISCPPHHYAPSEGLAACLPCGSRAQQPLPGQDKCACLAEGQVFQVSIYTCTQTVQQYPVVQSVVFTSNSCSCFNLEVIRLQILSVFHSVLNCFHLRFNHRQTKHNKQVIITQAWTKAWRFLPMIYVSFMQSSDGQCHCALGYRATQRGDACKRKIYEICKNGQARDQYGKCLDRRQWKHLCSNEVSTRSHFVKSNIAIIYIQYLCELCHPLLVVWSLWSGALEITA